MKSIILSLVTVLFCYHCSSENDFATGEQAYLSGDYHSAIEILKPLAEQGHVAAMFYLGRMHEKGRGMKVDFAEARRWYESAAAKGMDSAMNNLGIMYREGRGGRQDYQEAAKWFRQAALQNNDDAQLSLAAMYVNGQGVRKDYAEAYAWYTVSSDLGNEYAAKNLTQLRGWMRRRDFERGERRLQKLLEEIDNAVQPDEPVQYGAGRNDVMASVKTNRSGWNTVNANFFSLRHPDGWSVQGPDGSGKIMLIGREQEHLIIWPIYLQQSLSREGASRLASRMAQLADQSIAWQYPSAQGNWVRCSGRRNGRVAMTAMYWVPLRQGTAGFVYALSAPEQVYARNEATYAEIFHSFQARQGKGGGAGMAQQQPRYQFVRWQDPVEQAVSFEVPQSWSMRGGLVRRTALDYTFTGRLQSPDGQIEIFMGDPNLPPFVLPNQMLEMSGMGEGSWYQMTDGTRALVQRYQTGAQFAGSYVQQAFGRTLGSVQITRAQDRPDISEYVNRLNRQYGAYGVEAGLSTGEVYFQGRGRSAFRQMIRVDQ